MGHISNLTFAGRALIPGAVFTASVLGSLHCASMCGPLVLAVASDKRAAVLYHFGRLLGYTTLGALFGFMGNRLLGTSTFRILPILSTLTMGTLFVSMGIAQLRSRSVHLRLPAWLNNAYTLALRRAAEPRHGISGAFVVGLLSVFLPCGWLYSFLLSAAATQNFLLGGALLVAFWAGTLPALLLGPIAFQKLIRPTRNMAPRLAGILLIFAGVITLGFRAYPAFCDATKPASAVSVHPHCPMHTD